MVCRNAHRGIVFLALAAGASALSRAAQAPVLGDTTKTTFTHPPKPTTTTRTTTTRTTVTFSGTTRSYYSITTVTDTSTTATSATSSTSTATGTTKTRLTKTSVTSTTGTSTTPTSTTYTRTWKRMRQRRQSGTTTTGTTTTKTSSTRTKYPKPTTTTTLTTISTSTATTTTATLVTTTTTSVPCTCGSQGRVLHTLSRAGIRAGTCADKEATGFLFGGRPAGCASMARFCRDPDYAAELQVSCPVTCCAFSFQHPNASKPATAVPIAVHQPEQNTTGGANGTFGLSCLDSEKVPCKLLSLQCNTTEYGDRVRVDCPRTCGVCRP